MSIKVGESKLLTHREHFERWRRGENPGPLVIEVGPTHGCNHNCVHCGFQQHSAYDANTQYYDHPEAFKRFLDDFRALGGVEVYFAGAGEPMLNPYLADWVQHGHNLGLDMTISTNAMPLRPEKLKRFLPYMKWIKFSVNGGNRDAYTRVHQCPPGDFDALVENLASAVRYRNEHQLPVRLFIQFVIYDLNWQSAADMAAIHAQTGSDLLVFRKAILDADYDARLPLEDIRKALQSLETHPNVKVRWDSFDPPAHRADWRRCYGVQFRTNMDPYGNVYTCARNFHTDSVYGNITTQRFADIWNSPRKKTVFEQVHKGEDIARCGAMCQTAYDNKIIEHLLTGADHADGNPSGDHRMVEQYAGTGGN